MVDVQYNNIVSKNNTTITYIPVKHIVMFTCIYVYIERILHSGVKIWILSLSGENNEYFTQSLR